MQCQHYVKNKNRLCKLSVREGEQFCGQHTMLAENKDINIIRPEEARPSIRIPCPFDKNHTCDELRLKKHMSVCNSRPKQTPIYIMPGINLGKYKVVHQHMKLADLGGEELNYLLDKISSVYDSFVPKLKEEILSHSLLEEEMDLIDYGPEKRKHALQRSSLLGHAQKAGILKDSTTYVEFGAGRGHLSFYVAQALKENNDISLLLVDRASYRHKCDNKLKHSTVPVTRVRADIADMCLQNVPDIFNFNQIVFLSKHLCGAATDLALRCVTSCDNVSEAKHTALSILIALCCHHRCDWNTYTGKKFMLDSGFTPEEFSVMCGISSWATCGPRRTSLTEATTQRAEEFEEEQRSKSNLRQLSEEEWKAIGHKAKGIINYGRQLYLERKGFKCKLFYYVNIKTSPENVCILARKRKPLGKSTSRDAFSEHFSIS